MVWEDLIKTALIGTDRTKLSEDTLKELAKLGIDTSAHPARVLMDAVSFYASMQKTGRVIDKWNIPLPSPCEVETKPICSSTSAQHLSMILNSNHHEQILTEFLQQIRLQQMIVPTEQLPELLYS